MYFGKYKLVKFWHQSYPHSIIKILKAILRGKWMGIKFSAQHTSFLKNILKW